MFDVEREFLIAALFDEINSGFHCYFTRGVWSRCTLQIDLFPQLKKTYRSISMRATSCCLINANYKFSVTGLGVDLQRRTCTCRIFDLDKIPCPYVMAVFRSQHGTILEIRFTS
ncbi:hypothetical protein EJD97_020363, partial [Solanum chilense]